MKPFRSVFFPAAALLAALASPSAAQHEPKPAPQLPPFVPDVKLPAVDAPRAPAIPRQEPTGAPATKPAKPIDAPAAGGASPIDFTRVHFDEAADGTLWARARTYKASFGAGGATYIPFLGSDAPRNFPVRVSLERASVGGADMVLATPAVTRAGDVVALDRGAIREVWHLDLDQAEQTFELAQKPPTAGDLRIFLAVDSDLELRADAEGFALDGPSGGVRIGRATAIDADGRRLALDASSEGGAIRIDVPDAFVRSARFPLVVDPVYLTNALDGYGNECALPDLAHRSSYGDFGAVFQYSFSATDADVWAVDLYFGQPVAGSGTWVDSSGDSWGLPRVAYNALNNTLLTVAQVRVTPNAPGEIWCRARVAGTSTQHQKQLVQSSILGSCFYPDVGGDPVLSGPTYFLAAWTRNFAPNDWDVHARLIGWDGVPVGGPILLASTNAFEWRPSVSKTDGRAPYDTQTWNIAWIRDATPTDLDIYGAQIRWDGTLVTPPFVIDSSTWNDSNPSASSPLDGAMGPRPWVAAFQRQYSDSDIIIKLLGAGTVLDEDNLTALEFADPAERQSQPDVDSNGQRFLVAYSESYNGSQTDNDAYFSVVAYDENGFRVDEGHVNFDYSTRDTYGIQVACSTTSSNFGTPLYGLAWPQYGSGNGDVFSGSCYEPQTFDSFCAGDGSAGTCPCGNTGASGRGCANSVTDGAGIYPSGMTSVSADTFSLQAFNLPASASCLFFQGTHSPAMGSPFGDGLRCVSGFVVRIASKTASAGNAVYPGAGDLPISVKGNVPGIGAVRAYQVWYRNAAAFCTGATFNLSSGIRVRWLL